MSWIFRNRTPNPAPCPVQAALALCEAMTDEQMVRFNEALPGLQVYRRLLAAGYATSRDNPLHIGAADRAVLALERANAQLEAEPHMPPTYEPDHMAAARPYRELLKLAGERFEAGDIAGAKEADIEARKLHRAAVKMLGIDLDRVQFPKP